MLTFLTVKGGTPNITLHRSTYVKVTTRKREYTNIHGGRATVNQRGAESENFRDSWWPGVKRTLANEGFSEFAGPRI